MIRKQFYIDPHHDYLLKKLARAMGTTEAELVRRALEAHLNTGLVAGRNLRAWEAERSFIQERGKMRGETRPLRGKDGRTWLRDDLYDR